jgi:hypothetical protein
MKNLAARVIGVGIVLLVLGASAAVVAAPTTSGVKACENAKGDLALLSGKHCSKHFSKVTIAKAGPRGAKGARGPSGPGALTLHFYGASTAGSGSTTLTTVNGITYTFLCQFNGGGPNVSGLLQASSSAAFNYHGSEATTGSGSNTLGTPTLEGGDGSTLASILGATAQLGQSDQSVISPVVITVLGPPAAVQQVTGYLEVTGGDTAANSTCDLEAEVTPSS